MVHIHRSQTDKKSAEKRCSSAQASLQGLLRGRVYIGILLVEEILHHLKSLNYSELQ